MKKIIFFLILIITFGCAQDKQPLLGETEFQRAMNAVFKDASKSPLKDKDRKNFKGLDFFPFDSTFVVTATLTRTPEEKPFKMKTTTDRLHEYIKYGVIEFNLKGEMHQLNIFQDLDLLLIEGQEGYLFLPFLDKTNGDTSYGGGRYVESRIPEGNTILIDFNTAYNPYCVYDERYSCPIVPRENFVSVEVNAGLKDFKKQ